MGQLQIIWPFIYHLLSMPFLRGTVILHLRQTPILKSFSRSNKHINIGSVSSFSSEINISDERRCLHNKLLYRSRHRGFLELDLILGNWVEENLRSLDESKIESLVDVLDLENPDLWKWLSGQEKPPDAVKNNPVFYSIQSKVQENLKIYASAEARADPGQPWVRGWEDKSLPDGGPKHGNQ